MKNEKIIDTDNNILTQEVIHCNEPIGELI